MKNKKQAAKVHSLSRSIQNRHLETTKQLQLSLKHETGSKAKNKFQTKPRTPVHHYQTGTPSVSPDSSPLSLEYFKPTFNLPTPTGEQRSKPSPWDGHLVLHFHSQAPPNTSPALWSLPNGISHSANHTLVLQSSSSEEMLMWKHSQLTETRQRGVGKAMEHH